MPTTKARAILFGLAAAAAQATKCCTCSEKHLKQLRKRLLPRPLLCERKLDGFAFGLVQVYQECPAGEHKVEVEGECAADFTKLGATTVYLTQDERNSLAKLLDEKLLAEILAKTTTGKTNLNMATFLGKHAEEATDFVKKTRAEALQNTINRVLDNKKYYNLAGKNRDRKNDARPDSDSECKPIPSRWTWSYPDGTATLMLPMPDGDMRLMVPPNVKVHNKTEAKAPMVSLKFDKLVPVDKQVSDPTTEGTLSVLTKKEIDKQARELAFALCGVKEQFEDREWLLGVHRKWLLLKPGDNKPDVTEATAQTEFDTKYGKLAPPEYKCWDFLESGAWRSCPAADNKKVRATSVQFGRRGLHRAARGVAARQSRVLRRLLRGILRAAGDAAK